MKEKSLLVFDFDGVIIDGISEYWESSNKAFINLVQENINTLNVQTNIPKAFKDLRPWVQYGWEMVLIAAELSRPKSKLKIEGFKIFANNYHENCKEALKVWNWSPHDLQKSLDNTRKDSINNDLLSWLNAHKAFPGIINRLIQFQSEGYEIAILTTKSAEFTFQILKSINFKPNMLFGHESGTKKNVLLNLSKKFIIKAFIEDRRATLERIISTPELIKIPCYLATWGYLKPQDFEHLPSNIQLLDLKTLNTPITNWP